ncbi:hypothetical protein KVV02_006393 [Mortierella alpina]|uniref:Adhesin domain-containing protein n=1 Tax=Mortierella alpina TaxID=64518 RepID=A0A9P8D373_MORAP|nr:hypothetical protein KVV02_006393 [Mortierella alpina]
MGLFTKINKPLLAGHYENEDVQISAELCPNIAINVVGLAKGEITILSGNEDMVHIKTSVQAKESILKNAAALEPVQDGDRYTYTIHTPLEDKLEKAVAFQVFVTIPRQLDSLESFTVQGANVELAIGNISHTFIRNLSINNSKGDISIDNFYGESAIISSTTLGGISGKYSVARLIATAKSGRIFSDVHLLNTDDQLPSPKVVCSATNSRIDLNVDGSDLFGPFTVEAKTQCAHLETKILLASREQRLLGNFINFGGPTRIRMSGNFQGRIETRTHYGKIFIDEPEFVRLEGAVLTIPSLSDRTVDSLVDDAIGVAPHLHHPHQQQRHQRANGTATTASTSSAVSHHSNVISSRTSSQGTSMSWGEKDLPMSPHPYHTASHAPTHTHTHDDHLDQEPPAHTSHPPRHSKPQPQPQRANHGRYNPTPPSSAGSSSNGSDSHSRADSVTGSLNENRSVNGGPLSPLSRTEKQRKKDEERDSIITREMIGTIGQGTGLIMAKNSSGDITVELI